MRESWRTYHCLSEAAKVICDSGDKDWKLYVTFERVRPLNNMYKMLLDERATLTVDRAAGIIGEYPPILITTEEELKMSKPGFQHGGEPESATPMCRFPGSASSRTGRRTSRPRK
jgi:hypothetical protein